MPVSAWIIGSVRLDASNIEVNGNNEVTSAGYWYLRHSSPVVSLIDHFETLIHTQAPNATVFITEGRRVRIEPDAGEPVGIDWLSNTTLRDLLGFTGNITESEDPATATNISPLLWSPGFPATPDTVLGTPGYVVRDQTTQVSADGTQAQTTSYYSQNHQDLRWTEVMAERMRVAEGTDGGGTFHELYEQSLVLGYSCRYYEQVTEVDGSNTAVTWDDSSDNSFGPYVLRQRNPRWYRRAVRNADAYSPLTLQLMQVAEYS